MAFPYNLLVCVAVFTVLAESRPQNSNAEDRFPRPRQNGGINLSGQDFGSSSGRPNSFGSSGGRPNSFGQDFGSSGGRPNSFGQDFGSTGGRPNSFGSSGGRPNSFGQDDFSSSGGRPNSFGSTGGRPNSFGQDSSSSGSRPTPFQDERPSSQATQNTTPSTSDSTAATTRIPPRDPGNRIVYIVSCPCQFTRQYSPVCGTDGQTYGNMGVLQCAKRCGTNVDVYLVGACGRNNG